jgi:hypothetical protein
VAVLAYMYSLKESSRVLFKLQDRYFQIAIPCRAVAIQAGLRKIQKNSLHCPCVVHRTVRDDGASEAADRDYILAFLGQASDSAALLVKVGLMENQIVEDETPTHGLAKRLTEKDHEIARLHLQVSTKEDEDGTAKSNEKVG